MLQRKNMRISAQDKSVVGASGDVRKAHLYAIGVPVRKRKSLQTLWGKFAVCVLSCLLSASISTGS
jgi:hypothetical protein